MWQYSSRCRRDHPRQHKWQCCRTGNPVGFSEQPVTLSAHLCRYLPSPGREGTHRDRVFLFPIYHNLADVATCLQQTKRVFEPRPREYCQRIRGHRLLCCAAQNDLLDLLHDLAHQGIFALEDDGQI